MILKSFTMDSQTGPFLNINEDRVFSNLDKQLFALTDAFGGHKVGEEVSQLFLKELENNYGEIIKDRDSTLPFFYSASFLVEGNALVNSVLSINQMLFQRNSQKNFSERAGLSSIIVALSENVASLLSVGNCRAYLWRDHEVKKILLEDTFDIGTLEQHKSALQNVPAHAFGLYSDLTYQLKEVRIQDKDKLILLSDGAYAFLEDLELRNIIGNENNSSRERIEEIFQLNNRRGNLDNQSCFLLEF